MSNGNMYLIFFSGNKDSKTSATNIHNNGNIRGVYRIVHKKLERKCERKACKYKEFERFEGDLGKKNEMYTGLICFNLV